MCETVFDCVCIDIIYVCLATVWFGDPLYAELMAGRRTDSESRSVRRS